VALSFLGTFGELASGTPWIYSGWLLIFSSKYRDKVRRQYGGQGPLIFLHWLFSLVMVVAEVTIVLYFMLSGESI